MPKTSTILATPIAPSQAVLFARLWDLENGSLTPDLARHLLTIQFAEADKLRMHELAVKNQEGRLSSAEAEELDNYVQVADLLTLLQAKARLFLKKTSRDGRDHG